MVAIDCHIVSRDTGDERDHPCQRRQPLRLELRLVARLPQLLALCVECARACFEQDLVDIEPDRTPKRIFDRFLQGRGLLHPPARSDDDGSDDVGLTVELNLQLRHASVVAEAFVQKRAHLRHR